MPFGKMNLKLLGITCLVFGLTSCGKLFKKQEDKPALARVGDAYLYQEDIASLVTANMSKEDSAAFVSNYINTWASKQLLMNKSKINLPENKLAEFDRLVSDYKTDLYTRAYLEALVQKALDTTITEEQLTAFYQEQKENFKLNERVVQLRFVVLPPQFLNMEEVKTKLKSFKPEDKQFLDSIAVQFKKIHLNDSIWISTSRLTTEIPALTAVKPDDYLKKSQFFELQDSLGVYLGKVNNVLKVNDIAPLPYVEPNIKQIILNRRRLELMRKLETELIDEAVKTKDFEIYAK
ncbi:peptidyl-prolyl cis-trans isomerase [Croceivirga sp. JEA036]|nr:peptidyl-prolyl cis-trans isomerase [Croceivirga sp. JEA036]